MRVRKVRSDDGPLSCCVPEPHGEGTWVLDVVPMMQQLSGVLSVCVAGAARRYNSNSNMAHGTTSHRAKAKSPRRAECCWQHALEHFTSIIHVSDG